MPSMTGRQKISGSWPSFLFIHLKTAIVAHAEIDFETYHDDLDSPYF